jgi:glycosyltransferase involved in cell wall biosynthesis
MDANARTTSLRLAHLIESDGPGGAERMLVSLATELQAAGGHNVVIVPASGEGWLARQLYGTGVHVELFHLDRPFSPAFAGQLEEILRRHRVALAHSHEFTMAVYGAWASRRAGIPHLFTMHGSRYYADRLRRRIALRIAATSSDAVVAVSHILARQLRRDLWLSADRVVTVPNGVRHVPVEQSSLREELHLTVDDQVVVAVGSLYPVKGHSYLLQAIALLTDRFPRLHLAIAGRGELADSLRALAYRLEIAERVHLLGLRSDVGNVLAAADVFALPSLSEGLPLALLEAMLSAKPIVATGVGEVPAVLDGGRAGVVVRPGDAAALADALAALLSDPKQARQLGATAAARASEAYTFSGMMDRYTELYKDALSPARSSNPQLESLEIAAPQAPVGR